jgi:hypothetical protein
MVLPKKRTSKSQVFYKSLKSFSTHVIKSLQITELTGNNI